MTFIRGVGCRRCNDLCIKIVFLTLYCLQYRAIFIFPGKRSKTSSENKEKPESGKLSGGYYQITQGEPSTSESMLTGNRGIMRKLKGNHQLVRVC